MSKLSYTKDKPSSYPRRLLVLVAGLTPQIVTETLYALANQEEPFIPTEIHLITTQTGAERAQRLLLKSPPAYYQQLVQELNLPAIKFSTETIHLLRNASGEPLADIRSVTDNVCVADQIMALMRAWTSDEQAALHVSLAGGRKTMSYYLGTALSLFGRAQDRLSHVLVDEAFENHREFFFPTKNSQLIYGQNNQPLDTAEARVVLAEIPFVRLTSENPNFFTKGKRTFSEVVDAAQQAIGPLQLLLNPVLGELRTQGQVARLADTDMAFLLWFIEQGWDANNPWRPPSEGDFDIEAAAGFLNHYIAVQKLHGGTDDRPQVSLSKGMDLEWFRNRVKHLKQKLSQQLGTALADRVRVVLIKRSPARYGLAINLDQLVVENYTL